MIINIFLELKLRFFPLFECYITLKIFGITSSKLTSYHRPVTLLSSAYPIFLTILVSQEASKQTGIIVWSFWLLAFSIYGGNPPKRNLFIKKYVFILTHLNFSHLPSTLHFIQYTSRLFSTAQQFLNSSISMPVSAFDVFHFTSSTMAKHFPLRTFFHQGNKKRVVLGEIKQMGRMGRAQGHAIFGQKLLNTQRNVGRHAHKSLIMKWANVLEESSQKFPEAERSCSQQCQLVHWYRCVPRTLAGEDCTTRGLPSRR